MNSLLRIICLAVLCAFLGSCDRPASVSAPAPKSDIPRLTAIQERVERGEYEDALREAKIYVADYPECFQGWNQLGWSYLKQDEPQREEAVTCFEKAIQLNPRSDNSHVGLGVVRRGKGDLKGARESYAEAIRIEPKNGNAYSSLLVIELIEKNYEKAVEYGEKAWEYRKDLASIPANLSIVYHYMGNKAKRDHFYQEAKDLKYPHLDTVDRIFAGELSIDGQ